MNFKYSKVDLIAKRILDECGINDPTEMTLPEIILGRKAFYEEVPIARKDGEIVSVRARSIVTVNEKIQFPFKKRFVAAHELGHYEMHKSLQPIFSDDESTLLSWYQGGPHEMEANEFAAEFLMPSELFYNECKGKKFGPSVIDHLSERFQVSKTATILKFVKRGNHPVFIVFCKDNQMKWWKKSDDFYHYSVFERNAPPPTGTVAYECFTKGTYYTDEERKQQIWKGDWFKLKRDVDETPFFEYCLFVPSYNYSISVIWEK